MKVLNRYFRFPLLIDIVVSLFVTAIFYWMKLTCIINLPTKEMVLSIITDISTISFTSAGFVLTFLTLLISFKISTKPITKNKRETLEDTYNELSIFTIFLNTSLYTETVKYLKNGVKELLIIAIVGYGLKLLTANISTLIMFHFSVFGIVIISLVLWRSLIVLSRVLLVQDDKE